jgi:ribonucleoside-diphosphate reductase alpha chain
MEDDVLKPHTQAVLSIPQKAPEGAYCGSKGLDVLDRVKRVYNDWIKPSHRKGTNTHNVSCTVELRNDEWAEVGDWLWNNRQYYAGITLFPRGESMYEQAPFEAITKEKFEELNKDMHTIDLSQVKEDTDNTTPTEQAACVGGQCALV